ncbi:MAG: prolipoprotein diacylglyceryl transferase, partial [Mycobacterium sp.]|nr:prolipoprotein diacylglyceryl transferase [Mycobacterium sp.]
MTSTVLAYFPSPAQGVWHLGPVPIRAYALFIIIGIIAALVIGDRRWVARGGQPGTVYDIAPWAVLFGLIGGRLYHVMTDWQTYFGEGGAGLLAAVKVWDGGLGIWGAVALGGVGAWIGCRRRGIPLPAFGDAIAPGIVLAQAIGRLGNYFNQELYGRETTVPWGMEIFYRRDPSGLVDVHSLSGVSTGQVAAVVHPTFLYELLWNLLVFALLIVIDRRFKMGHGRLFALYVAAYCVGRFCVELLRSDAATQIEGIRINSFTSTFVFLGAVVYIILAKKGREDPESLRGNLVDEEQPAPELVEELVAVAGTTGVVAAATVAGREDSESETDEPEPEPETEPTDADDVEADAEDEAVVEAEVAAPGVVVETAAEAEEELIDEDHDPVDEEELEELAGEQSGAPVSEQEEALESEPESEPADADDDADDLEEVAEVPSGAPVSEQEEALEPGDESEPESEPADADDVEGDAEDEAVVEAEVVAPDVVVESAAEAEGELIDEDHDPVDEEDLEEVAEVPS